MQFWTVAFWRCYAMAALALTVGSLANATPVSASEAAANKSIPIETQTLLKSRSISNSAPIYIRVFKEESELEVWKARPDGRYVPIKTFPICKWSGALGPKQTLGDLMSPEGFYGFGADGLKPDSKYHLALNVGYPNALDRALGRSGDFIMVHGNCDSVGCFAMTDDLIEEIYAFAREAIAGGEERIPLHIFPFRLTVENMKRHAGYAAFKTWAPLKEAYDDFAMSHEPPKIAACGKHYVVNPASVLEGGPAAVCPSRIGKLMSPVSPHKAKRLAAANAPLIAEGPKMRYADEIGDWTGFSALGGPKTEVTPSKVTRPSADGPLGGLTPLIPPSE